MLGIITSSCEVPEINRQGFLGHIIDSRRGMGFYKSLISLLGISKDDTVTEIVTKISEMLSEYESRVLQNEVRGLIDVAGDQQLCNFETIELATSCKLLAKLQVVMSSMSDLKPVENSCDLKTFMQAIESKIKSYNCSTDEELDPVDSVNLNQDLTGINSKTRIMQSDVQYHGDLGSHYGRY